MLDEADDGSQEATGVAESPSKNCMPSEADFGSPADIATGRSLHQSSRLAQAPAPYRRVLVSFFQFQQLRCLRCDRDG